MIHSDESDGILKKATEGNSITAMKVKVEFHSSLEHLAASNTDNDSC